MRQLSVVIATLVLVAAPSQRAGAGMIMLTGTPGDWVVEFPDSGVSLFWDTAHKENNTQGTLNEITNRTNNDPITLTFRQTTASTKNSAVAGGLRVNFQKDDSNIVGPDWISYQLQLIDDVPGPNINFSDHPPQPHFHPMAPIAKTPATFIVGQQTFSGNDTNKYMSTFKGQAGADDRMYPDTILFQDVVRRGEELGIRNLLIHERLFKDPNKRTFRLVETPNVPEPSSLALLATGGFCLVTCGFRTWKRRHWGS